MWLATTLGFFSIVQKEGGWFIRARNPDDLKNLQQRHAPLAAFPIIETIDADYCSRIIVPMDSPEADKVMSGLFQIFLTGIDYPNFKEEIHRRLDQKDKCTMYGQIWAEGYTYQRERVRRNRGALER